MSDAETTINQSDGDSIKVFVRVRPPAVNLTDLGDGGRCLDVDQDGMRIRLNCKPEPKVFTFDQVADIDATQESVFADVGKSTIDSCFAGYNGTIFAYGQTGSGKTYTMLGPADNCDNFQHELRGVIPRSFEYLFNIIKTQQEQYGDSVQFLCKCSFLEIYQEQIFDLLDAGNRGLQLRENIKYGAFVDGLAEVAVHDAPGAYECLASGWMNRTVAATDMNRESSRSHAVFTVYIESKKLEGGVWNVLSSQLNLVDLAGSERQKDTKTTGMRLKEAGVINKSLSTLGHCIMALVDIEHGKTRHIPYRDSKLTFLLKDSLGGNAKTEIIACVHPGARYFGETLSTLQFARRAKMIKNKARVNEDLQGSVVALQAEIRKLKETLSGFQTGATISTQPSLSANSLLSTEDGNSFKQYFLEAMFFRQNVLDEKKLLLTKYKSLQEMFNRKEQALRQNKMILKFREDALKKYQTAQGALSDDEKNVVISSLREEMKILEDRLNHHPGVLQLRNDNQMLRHELEALRSSQTYHDINQQQAQELHSLFLKLTANAEKPSNGELRISGTPQKNCDVTFKVATIERNRTQITKLTTELESMKRELAAEREQSQHNLVEKEAEVISLRKAKEELEKNLEAHRVRYKVERDNMEGTIKNMTTPKRAKYLLRNRTVMVPMSGCMSEPLGEPEHDMDMSGSFIEEQPESEPLEDKIESLEELLKNLQEENQYLHVQRDNLESQVLQLVEEVSRVESQRDLSEQLYCKAKTTWATTEDQLNDKIKVISTQLQSLTEDRTVLFGEVQDLRLMYDAAEKRYKEARDGEKRHKENREKEVGALETKCMQMELEIKKIQRELDQLTEEQVTLRESEENCQMTLDFTQEKLSQAEQSLIQANKANLDLQSQIDTAESRIKQEKENSHKLCEQLHQRGDQQQKLAEALNDVESAQRKARELEGQLKVARAESESLYKQLAVAMDNNDRLQTAQTELREMVMSLKTQLSEKREQLVAMQHAMDSLTQQVDEYSSANIKLVDDNERLRKKFAEECLNLDAEMQKQKVQVELQQEDLDQMMEEKEELMMNLTNMHSENSLLIMKSEDLIKELEVLKEENQSLSNTVTELKQALEGAKSEKQDVAEKDSEIDFWKSKNDELEARWTELLKAFDTVSSQQHEKNNEIRLLKDQLSALVAKQQDLEITIDLLRTECTQYKLSDAEWVSKLTVLEQRLTEQEEECTRSLEQANLITEQNKELSAKIEEITKEKEEKLTEFNSLKETLETRKKQFDEMQHLCEQFSSSNKVLQKEREDLREQFQKEADEKARLAGNHNNMERIKYVEKISGKLREVTLKYESLLIEHQKCKAK